MITPAGRECRYYYEDFHRGRSTQECRLILANPRSPPWRPDVCFHCPVPDIIEAPGAENLALEGTVERRWLGLRQRVVVSAVCTQHLQELPEPHRGCPACVAEAG